jgi:hypothetical protein
LKTFYLKNRPQKKSDEKIDENHNNPGSNPRQGNLCKQKNEDGIGEYVQFRWPSKIYMLCFDK